MENEQTIKQERANTAQQAAAAPQPARPAATPTETKPAENELQLHYLAPEDLHAEMQRLKDEEHFDFLETLTGMDWGEDGLGVVYNLWSTTQNKRISLKTATTDRENPFLPTVSDLWNIANIYEREVFDFFGIKFLGHPDMRRIFLREDWSGYPMRKDDKPEEENPLRMDNEPLADVTTQYNRQPDGSITTQENTIFTEDDYVVNIGPQHPSTHGVLHFRVALEGERIRKIDPILGYIHRGIEKLNESLTYPQALALTERLDYLGAMQNRHALCMCIEKAPA